MIPPTQRTPTWRGKRSLNTPLSQTEIAKIKRYQRGGKSAKEIAALLGKSKWAIYKILERREEFREPETPRQSEFERRTFLAIA